jgi:outer membrane protein OmpU
MNNLKKIGLTALGTTLIASSAFAADFSVTGAASISLDQTSDKVGGTNIYMGDSLNFKANGEMDNGVTVAVAYEIDGGALDDHSITFGFDGNGNLRFGGHGDGSSLSSMDDKMPNAYEESWDIVAGTPTIINGDSGNNSFKYTSESMGGTVATLAYVHDANYMDFGLTMTPEAIDGLTVGYARGDTETRSVAAQVESTESTLYATYAIGSVTVGYQMSELDSPTAGSSLDSKAMGISYAVTDNFSFAYNTHKLEKENDSDEQKSAGFSASYTQGSMTLGGAKNKVESVANVGGTDVSGYEMTLSFAF